MTLPTNPVFNPTPEDLHPPTVEFDAESHTYMVYGERKVSVTQALSIVTDSLYQRIDPAVLEHAQRRGTYVHRACELYAQGRLDEATVDPEVAPYLEGFRRFLADSDFVVLHTEVRLYDRVRDYCGSADIVGLLNGEPGVMDLKTPIQITRPVVGAQLAGYKAAWNSMHRANPLNARWALRVTNDGKYRLDRFTDPNDLANFAACLAAYRFKAQLFVKENHR